MWTSAVEIFLHITHRSLHEIASRQSCCLLIEACAIEGKQQAVLGRIGNVVCDGVEVDGFLSGVAVHRRCTAAVTHRQQHAQVACVKCVHAARRRGRPRRAVPSEQQRKTT